MARRLHRPTLDSLYDALDNHRLWLTTDGAEGAMCDFSSSDVSYRDLAGAFLTLSKFAHARLDGSRLSRAMLMFADLKECSLVDASLDQADLIQIDLSNANLFNANLAEADLTNADLTCADFRGAKLAAARLFNSRIVGCLINVDAVTTSDYPLSWWLERGAVVEE